MRVLDQDEIHCYNDTYLFARCQVLRKISEIGLVWFAMVRVIF